MNKRQSYILRLFNSSVKWIFLIVLILLTRHNSWLFAYAIDTTKVEWRKFDEKEIEKFRNDKNFDYRDKKPTKAKETLNWFEKWIRELFDIDLGSETNKVIFDIITIILIVGALAVIIWVLTGSHFRWIFTGKGTKASPTFTIEEENIHEISFNDEIAAAEAAGNFRKAVRLHYLEMLKALSDHSLIVWQSQKTNLDYSRELQHTPYSEEFSNLTYWFDYIWYGEFPVDAKLYASIREKFLKFPIKRNHSDTSKILQNDQK